MLVTAAELSCTFPSLHCKHVKVGQNSKFQRIKDLDKYAIYLEVMFVFFFLVKYLEVMLDLRIL